MQRLCCPLHDILLYYYTINKSFQRELTVKNLLRMHLAQASSRKWWWQNQLGIQFLMNLIAHLSQFDMTRSSFNSAYLIFHRAKCKFPANTVIEIAQKSINPFTLPRIRDSCNNSQLSRHNLYRIKKDGGKISHCRISCFIFMLICQ